MKMRAFIFTLLLAFAAPLHAHRVEGLLQNSLVEVLPSQVGVEVTLVPGIDIAPKIVALLDADGDGVFSESESAAWSARFMAAQSVTVDGQSLPLKLEGTRASPLAEMNSGHAEIIVHFTADFAALARSPRTIVCANRYEPIPCSYQTNGLVPKVPSVRLNLRGRDERQQEITLAAEFSKVAASATPAVHPANIIPQNRQTVIIATLALAAFAAMWWLCRVLAAKLQISAPRSSVPYNGQVVIK